MIDSLRKPRHKICCPRKNRGYEASLETRKIYQVLPDPDVVNHRQLRVNDESGEDYLYLANYFSPIELP